MEIVKKGRKESERKKEIHIIDIIDNTETEQREHNLRKKGT